VHNWVSGKVRKNDPTHCFEAGSGAHGYSVLLAPPSLERWLCQALVSCVITARLPAGVCRHACSCGTTLSMRIAWAHMLTWVVSLLPSHIPCMLGRSGVVQRCLQHRVGTLVACVLVPNHVGRACLVSVCVSYL
jgi:hypothetical protein